MNPALRTNAKTFLSKVLPDSNRLRYLSYLPLLDRWKRNHRGTYPTFNRRHGLYNFINQEYLSTSDITYLEFGVFKGDSIRYWSEIHRNPNSNFVGFDTFTGLPEKWDTFTGVVNQNTFNVDGQLPAIDDSRVSFVKGLFQETLDTFLASFTPREQIVIHNDSDLYSATMYVLTRCHDIIVPGTIIMFDEFSSVLNEFRALEDYCSAYNRTYRVIGVTIPNYSHVAIQMSL